MAVNSAAGPVIDDILHTTRNRDQDSAEHPPGPARPRQVGHSGLHGHTDLGDQLGEFLLIQPQPNRPIAGTVLIEVDVSGPDVMVHVCQQTGQERHERPSVVIRSQREVLVVELTVSGGQRIGALDGSPYLPFAHHDQYSGFRQGRHLSIERGGRDALDLRQQLPGGQLPVAEESLDDPQPQRVQQELSSGHSSSFA